MCVRKIVKIGFAVFLEL